MKRLISRKLVLGALAIAGNVGIVVGLAVINVALITPEMVFFSLANVTAIAGIITVKQADIDKTQAASGDFLGGVAEQMGKVLGEAVSMTRDADPPRAP